MPVAHKHGHTGVDIDTIDLRAGGEELTPHLDATAFLHANLQNADPFLFEIRLQNQVVVLGVVVTRLKAKVNVK